MAPIPSPTASPIKGLSKTARPTAIPIAAPTRQQIHSGLFIRPDATGRIVKGRCAGRNKYPSRSPDKDVSRRRPFAAARCTAAVGQCRPVAVHSVLVPAIDDKRNSLGKTRTPGTIECCKTAAFQFKLDGDHLACRTGPAFPEARNVNYF